MLSHPQLHSFLPYDEFLWKPCTSLPPQICTQPSVTIPTTRALVRVTTSLFTTPPSSVFTQQPALYAESRSFFPRPKPSHVTPPIKTLHISITLRVKCKGLTSSLITRPAHLSDSSPPGLPFIYYHQPHWPACCPSNMTRLFPSHDLRR